MIGVRHGKAKILFRGYGNNSTTTPKDNAPDVLTELLTLGGGGAITSSDINTTSNHGGLAALDTDLNASMVANIGAGEKYHLAVREERKKTLGQIIGEVMRQHFIHIWRSARTGKFNAVVKQEDPGVTTDANGDDRTLRSHNIAKDSFSAELQDLRDIYNAFYINFDYDSVAGQHRGHVFLDNTTKGARDWKGDGTGDDTNLLVMATTLESKQDLFGRRVFEINAPYIHDAKVAWDVLIRRMNVHMDPRVIINFSADGWAWDIEPGMVFYTDTSLDNIKRYPGYTGDEDEPSWSGRKWFVTQVSQVPAAVTNATVTAINID
jgi:hypothetical protein